MQDFHIASFPLPLSPSHPFTSSLFLFSQEPGSKFATEKKIHENQMDIVRLLVSHDGDLNATDKSEATPRDLAMECDFYDCVDLIDELYS